MSERDASGRVRPVETLAYADRGRKPAAALDVTLAAATTTAPPPPSASAAPAPVGSVRSTVLPRVERREGARRVVVEGKPRYQEVRHLGEGGQAEVTLVRDHDIDRSVAVKRLRPELNDDDSVLRFAEEIRTVGQLEHPNIVPIHDVGVDEDGHYFFVMKYVQGETLESIIAKLRDGDETYARRYTPEYRLQICNELLRGVQHAHELGILHRDLKPGNVMVGSLGEVVVMDWGLAKRISDVETPADSPPPAAPAAGTDERARLFETQAGALLGTPAYMAPEQAEGKPLDVRSDVYSLAVMFYEFLSLRHPRSHCESVAEMIASVVSEPIAKSQIVSDFTRAGAPAALSHFVRHGIERDPALRYQTVAEMRERLELVRDGKAPIECPITFTQRALSGTSHAVNRHPILTFVVMGAGLLGGVAAVVLAFMR